MGRARRCHPRTATASGITLDSLFQRDGGMCHICGLAVARPDAEQDHVLAIANGGGSTPDNVRLSHMTCNRRKSDRLDWSDLRVVA